MRNPMEGIIDFEEDPTIIIDRFYLGAEGEMGSGLLELTRSLLDSAP